MNTCKLALVAAILSIVSGASVAAQTEGYLTTVQQPAVTSYATGSTTMVSLNRQLSGKPISAPGAIQIIAVSDSDSLHSTSVSYH